MFLPDVHYWIQISKRKCLQWNLHGRIEDNIPISSRCYGSPELDREYPTPSNGRLQPQNLIPGKIITAKNWLSRRLHEAHCYYSRKRAERMGIQTFLLVWKVPSQPLANLETCKGRKNKIHHLRSQSLSPSILSCVMAQHDGNKNWNLIGNLADQNNPANQVLAGNALQEKAVGRVKRIWWKDIGDMVVIVIKLCVLLVVCFATPTRTAR